MLRHLRLFVPALTALIAAPVFAGSPCEDLASAFDVIAREAEAEERQRLAFGLVAERCETLSRSWRSVLNAVSHASPADRPLIAAGGAKDEPALFSDVCPSWEQQPWAAKFAEAPPPPRAVYRACSFHRLRVATEKEFATAEVRLATTALVLYQVLVSKGLDAADARRLARLIIVPLGEPVAAPAPRPKLIKFQDLGKK